MAYASVPHTTTSWSAEDRKATPGYVHYANNAPDSQSAVWIAPGGVGGWVKGRVGNLAGPWWMCRAESWVRLACPAASQAGEEISMWPPAG
jgi:hypothetical protein